MRDARLQCANEHCGGNGGECKHVQMQSNKLSFVAAPVRGNFSNLNDLLKRGETPLVDTLDVNSASIASIMKNSFGVLDASKPAYASLFHGFVHLPRAGNYSVGIRGLLDGARLSLDERIVACDGFTLNTKGIQICPPYLPAQQAPTAWVRRYLDGGLHRIDAEFFKLSNAAGSMELRVWFVPSVTEREHDAIVKDPDAIPTIDADGSNITMYSVVNCSNFFKDNCATIDCIQGCDERSRKCADPNPQWWGIATTESMVPGTCECVDGFVGPSCSECDSFRFGKECHSLLLVIIPCSGGFLVILLVIFMVRYRRRLTEK